MPSDSARACAREEAAREPRSKKGVRTGKEPRRAALKHFEATHLHSQTQRSNRWLAGCLGPKASLHAEEKRVVSLTFHPGAFPKTVFREFARLDSVISASPSRTAMSVKQTAGVSRETRAGTSRKVQNRNRSKSPNTLELFFSRQSWAGAHRPPP